MRRASLPVVTFALTLTAAGCGSAPSKPPAPAPPSQATDAGGATSGAAPSEAATAAASKPEARPFAKTAAEVTSMIDDAVEKKREALHECVQDARKRRGDPRAKVEFDLGIDQEGTLIGVKTPKGAKDDAVLHECVRKALHGAIFPRSNAGVVTVRKTFVDQVVYPK